MFYTIAEQKDIEAETQTIRDAMNASKHNIKDKTTTVTIVEKDLAVKKSDIK